MMDTDSISNAGKRMQPVSKKWQVLLDDACNTRFIKATHNSCSSWR